MEKSLTIALSFEGVLANVREAFIEFNNQAYRTNIDPWTVKTTDLTLVLSRDEDELNGRWRTFFQTYHTTIKPVEGSVKAILSLLGRPNVRLMVFSNFPERYRAMFSAWLDWYYSGWKPTLVFSNKHLAMKGDREVWRKEELYEYLEISASIEDDVIEAMNIFSYSASTDVYLFDRPWNQFPTHDFISVRETWDELLVDLLIRADGRT